jgi:hypothetical protein
MKQAGTPDRINASIRATVIAKTPSLKGCLPTF